MNGYVARKRDRYYAVIYEGLDPITGRKRRSWHPAGTDRFEAEQLAERLASECTQAAEYDAVGIADPGWVFTEPEGRPVHPHAISQAFTRISSRAGVPVIRLHDLRRTHGSLLIKEGVPVKVVSERLGHANIAFTIETYQHLLPGMQADAARTFEGLVAPAAPTSVRPRRAG
jgi:integrase